MNSMLYRSYQLLPLCLVAAAMPTGCFHAQSSLAGPGPHGGSGTVEARSLGTAHPVSVLAAGLRGDWVVACQSREDTDGNGRIEVVNTPLEVNRGDALMPYIMFSDEEMLVDEFVGARKNLIAFLRDGDLILLDTADRTELNLSHARGDAPPIDPEMTVSAGGFDHSGRELLFVEGNQQSAHFVIRDLRTGQERRLEVGAGRVEGAHLLAKASWLEVRSVADESSTIDRSSEGDFPGARSCWFGSEWGVASLNSNAADTYRAQAIRVADGFRYDGAVWSRDAADVALLLQRDGSMRWLLPEGREELVAPASCFPELEALWSRQRAVDFQCQTGPRSGRFTRRLFYTPTELYEGDPVSLDIVSLGAPDFDRSTDIWTMSRSWRDRVLFATPEGDLSVFDFLARTTTGVPLPPGARSEPDQLVFMPIYGFGRWSVAHASLFTTHPVVVVDLEAKRLAGSLDRMPLAFEPSGRALVTSGEVPVSTEHSLDGSRSALETTVDIAYGPLHWVRPAPP